MYCIYVLGGFRQIHGTRMEEIENGAQASTQFARGMMILQLRRGYSVSGPLIRCYDVLGYMFPQNRAFPTMGHAESVTKSLSFPATALSSLPQPSLSSPSPASP